MTRRPATIARLFGVILILLVSAWDVDAMRAHIAAHSWTTLAFVSLFLAAHLSDYLTVGRIVNRFDPLAFAGANEITVATTVAYDEQQQSVQTSSTAELYVFTVVTTTQAQASGAPYPVTSQSITVQSEHRNAPAHPASSPSETRTPGSTGTASVLPWKKMRSDALPS